MSQIEFLPTSTAPAENAETTVSAREAMVKLLQLEGCKPRLDADGDIVFELRELTFLLLFDAREPEYIRLLLPNFCAVGTDAERAAAYEAANLSNATSKAAKVTIERGQTHAAVETFVASAYHVLPVLLRCAGALEHGARSFATAYGLIRRR